MATYRIISSDSHVFEPPDLWTSRVAPVFRERAPHWVQAGGNDQLIVDGQKVGTVGLISQAGRRFEAPEAITFEGQLAQVRPGGWDPDEHVKDMELDGIDGGVLYPSNGLFLFKVHDSELRTVIFQAYNDWLAEFCQAYPQRLKGIAMLNVHDLPDAVAELERCARLGLAGGMISVFPGHDRLYHRPEYDRLWAAAQALEMPLSLHTATQSPAAGIYGLDTSSQTATFRANIDYWVRHCLSDIIYGGVFDRFPRLKIGAVEFELAWVPYFLRMLDYVYIERQQQASYRYKDGRLPSDVFRSNVFVSFQEDDLGIQLRDYIGVETLMWGSDYPHAESTFPRSREILGRILTGLPEAEQARIAGENAARLYHFVSA
jgi:predicted TIM-barrel fold metal-dependent hydrolase